MNQQLQPPQYFGERREVYIGMDMLVYDKRGDRTSCLAREVLVTFDVQSKRGGRTGFGRLASRRTSWGSSVRRARPRGRRGEAGASPRWGMSAFWLYDPRGGHNPRLQGFRLAEGRSRRLPPKCRNESLLAVKSPRLGLELHSDGRWLRLWDPVVEDYLRT